MRKAVRNEPVRKLIQDGKQWQQNREIPVPECPAPGKPQLVRIDTEYNNEDHKWYHTSHKKRLKFSPGRYQLTD